MIYWNRLCCLCKIFKTSWKKNMTQLEWEKWYINKKNKINKYRCWLNICNKYYYYYVHCSKTTYKNIINKQYKIVAQHVSFNMCVILKKIAILMIARAQCLFFVNWWKFHLLNENCFIQLTYFKLYVKYTTNYYFRKGEIKVGYNNTIKMSIQ